MGSIHVRASHETYLSAFSGEAQTNTRLPGSNENARRSGRDSRASREGTCPPGCLTPRPGVTPPARLRRVQRLQSEAVGATLARGRRNSTKFFKLHYLPNALGIAAVALVVPKRLAKRAVDRTRVRRLIRETFRLNQQRLDGYDCVVRLTSAFAADADYINDLNDLWKTPKR